MFDINIQQHPLSKRLWSPGGLCVATFISHKLKEEMEATAIVILNVVAFTAATATACGYLLSMLLGCYS